MSTLLLMHAPLLMGIVNVTPDSFSDGGLFFNAADAIEGGIRMVDEGADILDVGGESTRPGSEGITPEEELKRVIPVVEGLAKRGFRISIDTAKAEVARRAIEAGASIVNDVTALADPGMVDVCVETGCIVCLMHMQGEPRTMQINPQYDDVVLDVKNALISKAEMAISQGISGENIWLDPGIGFGKTLQHNLLLLRHLDLLVEAGYPVLIGVSRKSFIGRVLGKGDSILPSDQRLEGTLAAQVLAQAQGAKIIRAHDVLSARRAIDMATAILG